MNKKCLVIFAAMVISLSIFSYSALAQLDAIAAPFKSLIGMLKNDNIVFGVLFFLFFILLYAAFVGGLNTIPAFKSEEAGKFTKNAKIVALTLSGITVLSTFFVAGRTDVLAHAKRIASMFNLFFAVLLSVILFFIVRHTFKGEGEIFGIESKNLMSILSLALALFVFGTIGDSGWAIGMGMTIFMITMIVVIAYAFGSLGGRDETPGSVGGVPYVPRGIDNVFGEQRETRIQDIANYGNRVSNYLANNGERAGSIQHIAEELNNLNQTLTDFTNANNLQDRYRRLEGVVRGAASDENQRLQADFAGLINAHNRIGRRVAELQRNLQNQTRGGQQQVEAARDTLNGVLSRGSRGDIVDKLEALRDAIDSDAGRLRGIGRDVQDLTQEWGDVQNRVWEQNVLLGLQRLGIV
ncbi:hypothetical protein KY326_01605 [Candidatus Woesearchaeota archaeon]|nr:hypothetical protein [Candidatus Woesearchaeota archaeon]